MARCFARAGWCVVGLTAGCTQAASPPRTVPPDVLVTVKAGVITAPDTVAAGWRRVRVEKDGASHIVAFYRLPATITDSALAAFTAAIDTARATPAPGIALGGAETGTPGELILPFTPGRYLIGCLSRGDDERRHLAHGETRLLIVPEGSGDAAHQAEPRATHTMTMGDFAYGGSDRWAAGPALIRIENTGRQDHQLQMARLRDGVTMGQWLAAENPDTMATPVAGGLARTSPGQVAYMPVDLRPGAYVIWCLIPDQATGKPHMMLGMIRAIEVRDGPPPS